MAGGPLAKRVAQGALARCLARRQALLEADPDALLAHAREASAETHKTLRAWVEPPDFDALEAAQQRRAREGCARSGPLAGLPLAVKDVIDLAGLPTRAGSLSRASAPPAECNALVVQQLAEAGALPVGKTTTAEFAYLDPPPTTNPFNSAHTPGGSSSGSAAIVGAGVVPLALGTQTAGSVCRPAAFCGVFAFKPSTGRTAPDGVLPFAPSFDTVGVMGLCLDQVLTAGEILTGSPAAGEAGPDPRARQGSMRGLRIATIADDYFRAVAQDCRTQIEHAREVLAADGHVFDELLLGVDFAALRDAHRLMMHVEAHQSHPGLLEILPHLLGAHWRNALARGAGLADSDYRRASDELAAARRQILSRLTGYDLVLVPPVYATAPASLESTGDAGLIVPWTYVGSPLVVMPTGLSEQGLPLAVMFAGLPGADSQTIAWCRVIGSRLAGHGLAIDRVQGRPSQL